jgi:hypothetical protein
VVVPALPQQEGLIFSFAQTFFFLSDLPDRVSMLKPHQATLQWAIFFRQQELEQSITHSSHPCTDSLTASLFGKQAKQLKHN